MPVRFGLVSMAENTDVRLFTLKKRSSIFRELSTFVQNMTDGNAEAGQFDHGL